MKKEKNFLIIYIDNEDGEIWNDYLWAKNIEEIIDLYWKRDIRILNIIEIGEKEENEYN